MKKRSSNQIKNFIIVFVAILMIVLVGLIVFLLNVDIKSNKNNQEQVAKNETVGDEQKEYEHINLENYDLVRRSLDGEIEIKISNGKVIFKVIDEDKFDEIYPDSVIDVDEEKEIAIHENKIEDVIIGEIKEKHYMLVLTNNGSIGIMNIDEAVENDVFRIKNSLISYNSPVVRMMNSNMNYDGGSLETVIVTLSDGNKYDLADIVE